MTNNDYKKWLGSVDIRHDVLSQQKVNALAATLDLSMSFNQADPLPPLWHWIFFNDHYPAHSLGHDGHAAKGNFLPPIALPRRMWAGGRFTFSRPLHIGMAAKRTSTIDKISEKVGKSGALAFVTVKHKITTEGEGLWQEEHDIVYKEQPTAAWQEPTEIEKDDTLGTWYREIIPDPVLLFRYSALTFNGHRIHYDRNYCIEKEGYPGLVFHGPLTATLLINFIRQNLTNATIKEYSFRAIRPLFDIHRFSLHGKVEGETVYLWAKDQWQQRAIEAQAVIEYI